MKPLTRILYAVRSFIDKLIAKTSKPQPFRHVPYPTIPYAHSADDWSYYTSDFNGSSNVVYNYLDDGTATGTNNYKE